MPAARAAKMPIPAAGSVLATARITSSQVTLRRMPSERPPQPLFNAGGAAQRRRASGLLGIGPSAPGPALRRGALVAVPVGIALLLELGLDTSSFGAIATGALLAGFPGLAAPARARAGWQAAVAPAIGAMAALGVLSSQSAVAAVLTMAVV